MLEEPFPRCFRACPVHADGTHRPPDGGCRGTEPHPGAPRPTGAGNAALHNGRSASSVFWFCFRFFPRVGQQRSRRGRAVAPGGGTAPAPRPPGTRRCWGRSWAGGRCPPRPVLKRPPRCRAVSGPGGEERGFAETRWAPRRSGDGGWASLPRWLPEGNYREGKGPCGCTADSRWGSGPGPGPGWEQAGTNPQTPSGEFTLQRLLVSEGCIFWNTFPLFEISRMLGNFLKFFPWYCLAGILRGIALLWDAVQDI